jgi:chromosome segregation ATPase
MAKPKASKPTGANSKRVQGSSGAKQVSTTAKPKTKSKDKGSLSNRAILQKERENAKEKEKRERQRLAEEDRAFRKAEREREKERKKARDKVVQKERSKQTAKPPVPTTSSIIPQTGSASTMNYQHPNWPFSGLDRASTGRQVSDAAQGTTDRALTMGNREKDLPGETSSQPSQRILDAWVGSSPHDTLAAGGPNAGEGPSTHAGIARAENGALSSVSANDNEIQDLKKQNEALQKALKQRDGCITKSLQQNTKATEQHKILVAALRQDVAAKEDAIAAKSREVKDLVTKHVNDEEARKQQIQVWNDDYDTVCGERDQLKQQLAEADDALAVAERKRGALKSELKALYETHKITQDRTAKEKEALAAESTLLKEANGKIAELNDEITSLKAKIAELERTTPPRTPEHDPSDAQARLERERKLISEERENSKKERESTKRMLDALNLRVTSLQNELVAKQRDNRATELKLRAKLKDAKARLDLIDESDANSERTLDSDAKQKHEELEQKHKELNQKYEDLFAKFEAVVKENIDSKDLKRKRSEEDSAIAKEKSGMAKEVEETKTKYKNIAATYLKVNKSYGKLRAAVMDVGTTCDVMARDEFGPAGRAIKRLKRELKEIDAEAAPPPAA